MANYQQRLEDAIVQAHEAGDTEAAKMLADELKAWKPKRAEPQTDYLGQAKSFGKGALSGAADIGNTLINAATFVPRQLDKLAGQGRIDQWNQERQSSLKDFNKANDSTAFTLGRIGSNIAGTLGAAPAVGGALAGMSQAPKALALARALQTNGAVGTLGERVLGSAGAGALSSLMTDPENVATGAAVGGAIPLAGAAVSKLGGGLADIAGLGTFTGGEPIRTAVSAGRKGGQSVDDFARNMRGKVPMTDVLESAKQNLDNMRAAKSAQYRSGMHNISRDKTVLDFSGIDNAINDAFSKATYKGQVKNQRAADAVQGIADDIAHWKSLDPAEFHTPEGMDALKQRIGAAMESLPFEERTARLATGNIYNAIKGEISKQAPTYSKVMKDYSEASDLITEIERSLVGKGNTSVDTSMRKLQSLMRNNVNTNYGNRQQLANAMIEKGGNDIMPALAGQSLNSVTPRGLGKAVAGAAGAAGALSMNPYTIPLLAAQSPRLVGEAALKLGQLLRQTDKGLLYAAPAGAVLANQ
jgi:hypothetical protein